MWRSTGGRANLLCLFAPTSRGFKRRRAATTTTPHPPLHPRRPRVDSGVRRTISPIHPFADVGFRPFDRPPVPGHLLVGGGCVRGGGGDPARFHHPLPAPRGGA